jgi:hypothetical protein
MDLSSLNLIIAILAPMVIAGIAATLTYKRRAILKGETFEKSKFLGTLALSLIISLGNYLTNGLIIPADNIVGILEASGGAVLLSEIAVKYIAAKFTGNGLGSGIIDAIYNYVIGLPVEGNIPAPSPGVQPVTPVPAPVHPSDEGYIPDLDLGLVVLPSRIEGPSPLEVKLQIQTSPRWGPNAPTRYVVQWYDGSPDSTGDIFDGEAEATHTYTYKKGASKYFSRHYRPDVTVYDEKGKSEGIPGLNEVSVDVFDAEAVAESRKGE